MVKKRDWLNKMILCSILLSFCFLNCHKVYAEEEYDLDKIVYVAAEESKYPLEYYDKKDEEYKGIIPDILNQLTDKTGIQFLFIGRNEDKEALIRNNQVELVSYIEADDTWIETYHLTKSTPIITYEENGQKKSICFAYTKILDKEIENELERTLRNLDQTLRETIYSNYLIEEQNNTELKEQNWVIIILGIAVVLLCLQFCLLMRKWLRRKKRIQDFSGYETSRKLEIYYQTLVQPEERNHYAAVEVKIKHLFELKERLGVREEQLVLSMALELMKQEADFQKLYAQIGEDSFLFFFSYVSKEAADKKLERIRNSFLHKTEEWKGEFALDMVMGIYQLSYQDEQLEPILSHAVWARKYAEENKKLSAVYDEIIIQKSIGDKELEKEAALGIEQKEFVPYFMSIYDIKKEKTMGYTVLSRWKNRKRGLLFPNKFIPILERCGLLMNMDSLIMEEACRILKQRKEEKKPLYPISCNLSRSSFHNSDFGKNLKELTEQAGIESKWIGIEITEAFTEENREKIQERIKELKQYGFTIILDNFGGRYSSNLDLLNCEIDYVNLSRELTDYLNEEKAFEIIKGIVRLCNDVGIKTIASGIESKEQLEKLKMAGCDCGIGFYFAQPMPYEEIEELFI